MGKSTIRLFDNSSALRAICFNLIARDIYLGTRAIGLPGESTVISMLHSACVCVCVHVYTYIFISRFIILFHFSIGKRFEQTYIYIYAERKFRALFLYKRTRIYIDIQYIHKRHDPNRARKINIQTLCFCKVKRVINLNAACFYTIEKKSAHRV